MQEPREMREGGARAFATSPARMRVAANLDWRSAVTQFGRRALEKIAGRPSGFIATDIAALVGGLLCAWILTTSVNLFLLDHDAPSKRTISIVQLAQFFVLGSWVILQFEQAGHYSLRLPLWVESGKIAKALVAAALVDGLLQFEARSELQRFEMACAWAFAGAAIVIFRTSLRDMARHNGFCRVPTLLVGGGIAAEAARAALNSEVRMGCEFVAQQVTDLSAALKQANYSWRALVALHGASQVVLAFEGEVSEELRKAFAQLMRERVPYLVASPPNNLSVSSLTPLYFFNHDVMFLAHNCGLDRPLPCFLKRCFDIVISGAALLLLSPLLLLVVVALKLDGGPVFYAQQRLGMGGKVFKCLKFRSMVVDGDSVFQKYLTENPQARDEWERCHKVRNDPRVTRLGAVLRRSSADELPQLINVLKGDMSLVGPRPIVAAESEKYDDDLIHYYRVRPGITGLWQVSGRSDVRSYAQRVSMDSWYVRNWSLWHDIAIICKTFPAVLKCDGAY